MWKNNVEFFLGSKSKQGFVSLFAQLQQPTQIGRTYILKGGPGSGKSTLMRKLGTYLQGQGHEIEWIPCASDPKSLDAIIDYTTRTAMLDGTAPHVVDPVHPGAVETVVNAGDAWDESMLERHRDAIVALTAQIDHCHAQASAYVAAAGSLLDRSRTVASAYVDSLAVNRWVEALAARLQPGGNASEQKRLLSAVSVGEMKFFDGTLRALCDTVYTIADDWGAASGQLLERLRERALEMGVRVITCYCSVRIPEKIDHLIFPDDRLAITTVNDFHATIHPETLAVEGLSRPLPEVLRSDLWQSYHTVRDLLEQACDLVARSKALHDDLERFYVAAMDFTKLDLVYEDLRRAMESQ